MGGKITSDKMQWELLIKDSEAQREIAKLTQNNKDLEKSNKEVRLEMAKLEAQGKRNSTEWNGLRNVLEKNSTEISNNTKLIKANEAQLGTQNMTMQQLKKRHAELQKELNNTSKALDPTAWANTKAKMDETKDAMDDMTGKTKKSEGVLLSWSSAAKVGVMGALAGIGLKLVSVAADWFSLDKIINSTKQTGDKFDFMMAGMANALDYVRVSLATMDFSNFSKNLQEAYRVASEAAESLDEVFERTNSFKMNNIKVAAEIEDLWERQGNPNLSYEERRIASEKIVALTLQQAEIEKGIAKTVVDAARAMLINRTKLNDKQLQYFVDEYNKNREVIKQAEKLIKLEDEANRQRNIGGSQSAGGDARALSSTKEYNAAVQNLEYFKKSKGEYLSGIKEVADIARGYGRSNDKILSDYVEATVNMINIDVEANLSLRRVNKNINAMNKNIADEALKKQEEISKLTREQQEKGYEDEIKAAEDASGKKLIALKKLYKDGIISQSEYAARSGEIEDELILKKMGINSIYSRSITELENILLSKQLERLEKQKSEFKKLWEEIESKTKKTTADMGQRDDSNISKEIENIEAMYENAANAATKAMEGKESKLRALENAYNTDVAALKDSLDLKMISQEQYEKGVTELSKESWKERFKINSEGTKKVIELIQDALAGAAQISQELQRMELNQLEVKTQKELELYGTTAEKRAEIQRKSEAEKLKIQKKYADIDMGIKIAQSLANGALAIMQAWATLPTPAAIAMTVVIGAITAAQTAAIIAQRNAIKNSSVSGSSSSSGGSRTLIGSGSQSTSGSQYNAPIINVPAARQPVAMTGVKNIQALINEQSSKTPKEFKAMDDIAPTLKELNKYLKDLKETPIHAYTVLDEHNAKQELRNRIKKVGSL